jgi:hypothetical protein
MKLIHPSSLADTVRAIDEAHFFGVKIPQREALAAARWIAGRQGLEGSYAATFAPMPRDWAGLTLPTGEKITTRAGLSHMLGEESCRVLRVLGLRDRGVAAALDRANAGMLERLHRHAGSSGGEYCCGPCSVAVWRHLAVGGLDAQQARLADGMRRLAQHRKPDGTWRRFPFYYTLLALTEIEGGLPVAELRHAAPRCERLVRRASGSDACARRRRAVLERALERLS